MKEIYSWVAWFSELSGRIANNGPDFLVERASRIPWKEGSDDAAVLRYGDDNIDPFSFVYSLAAHHHARRRVYARVAEEFALTSEIPLETDEAFIFPTPPLVTALFHDRGKGNPALLGRLFGSAVAGIDSVSGADFEQAQQIGGVAAAKLTQALFLINGREFLPYDDATQALRGAADREHRISWDDYRSVVAGLRQAFPGCWPYEINLLAYETSKKDNPLVLNPTDMWQISTRVYGHNDPRDMWEDFERNNCAYTGGPGSGGWVNYDPATSELKYRVGDPRLGDIVLVRNGRIGHGIGVVWKNDYAEALTSEARLHLLWLCKEDTQLEGDWRQLPAFTRAVGEAFREAYPTTFSFLDRVATESGEGAGSSRSDTHPNRRRHLATTGPLNTILYGPPGTGKTYRTISRSVEICDGSAPRGEELRARYDALVEEGRIGFVTFHQSYGYEEFVEGIRPAVVDGQVAYRVEDGILKRLAESARARLCGVRSTAERGSFDALWLKLVERTQAKLVRTRSSEREYSLTADPNSVVLEPVDGGDKRTYSRERVERLWTTGLRKAPEETTPAEVARSVGRKHGSFMWIIYKELWELGHAVQDSTGANVDEAVVLVIDEINRANISKVLGELITLLEEDKRQSAENELGVTLPYSRKRFTLPANLHILGTMNTADRSIALLDTALRRRFEFEELAPEAALLEDAKERTNVDLPRVLTTINDRLEYLIDRDHLIGHAWLMRAKDRQEVDAIMRRKVIPLIAEYFYDDWNKVRAVLGGTDDFIDRVELEAPPAIDQDMVEARYRWSVRQAFSEDAYESLVRGANRDPRVG